MYKLLTTVLLLRIFPYIHTAEETGLEEVTDEAFISNCAATEKTGIYQLKIPDADGETLTVFCEQETTEGGWTLVLQRFKGKLDFHNREWHEFKDGFGDFEREYFIGLEKLHLLSTTRTHSLLILMTDFDNIDYSTSIVEFEIDDEENNYEFKSGRFQGTEIGLSRDGTRFCSTDIPLCWNQLLGWQWAARNSKVTKNRLNLFGPYLKVGDSIRQDTMGFYNEVTQKVHPLRSIKILMRPVNIFRSSYGESFAEYY